MENLKKLIVPLVKIFKGIGWCFDRMSDLADWIVRLLNKNS